jgi:hypothetical protein
MQDPHDRRSLARDSRYRITEAQRGHEPGLGKPGRDSKQIGAGEVCRGRGGLAPYQRAARALPRLRAAGAGFGLKDIVTIS